MMLSEDVLRKLKTDLEKFEGKHGVAHIDVAPWPLERIAAGLRVETEEDGTLVTINVPYLLCFFDYNRDHCVGMIECKTIADIVCAARDFNYEMYQIAMAIFNDAEVAFGVARGIQ